MATEFSFDVVSRVDMQAVDDAVNTANREMANRFDFKGSQARIELDRKTNELTLLAENDLRLKSVVDLLQGRMVKRGVPLKNLNYGKIEDAEGSSLRQRIKIQQGLPKEKAKDIVSAIKEAKCKVAASIQEDQVRVSSKSKDDLQATITLLKAKDFGLDLQFSNYR